MNLEDQTGPKLNEQNDFDIFQDINGNMIINDSMTETKIKNITSKY